MRKTRVLTHPTGAKKLLHSFLCFGLIGCGGATSNDGSPPIDPCQAPDRPMTSDEALDAVECALPGTMVVSLIGGYADPIDGDGRTSAWGPDVYSETPGTDITLEITAGASVEVFGVHTVGDWDPPGTRPESSETLVSDASARLAAVLGDVEGYRWSYWARAECLFQQPGEVEIATRPPDSDDGGYSFWYSWDRPAEHRCGPCPVGNWCCD